MGNCQAIDNATVMIQHPCSRVETLYWPITASEVMKMNPGHHVALLLTTTSSPSEATNNNSVTANNPVRITCIKLLQPRDTLVLGQAYRLITVQEAMKALSAKKHAKMKKKKSGSAEKQEGMDERPDLGTESTARRSELQKTKQLIKRETHRSRITKTNSAVAKSRAWQHTLQSIPEDGS